MTITVRRLTVLLAMLVAVTPLAIDMYLPAMQMMATDLETPIHRVELSVSGFLLGFAMGQISGGSLSDRWGRKPAVALGLGIFAFTSIALIWVDTIESLLVLRVIQAIGGGIAVVNSSAVVRDLYSGKDMARILSMIAMVMMTAPLLAPMLGAFLATVGGWRLIFAALAGYAILVGILFLWHVPESNKRDAKSPGMIAAYLRIVRHRQAMAYILVLSFAFSGMFAFITAAPFTYLEHFGVGVEIFPFLFGANIITMMLFNRINVRLLSRCSPNTLMTAGVCVQCVAGAGLLVASMADAPLWSVVVCNMLFVGVLGLIAANATASCLQFFPDISASANAVIGVVEFCMGALVGLMWARMHDGTLVPIASVMFGCALLALFSFFVIGSKQRLQPEPISSSIQS
ncbi:Bcr/CflA family multidrug efflux MFS transporter [Pontibacterium granulatum]|uniref:Bcr/CflA family multidrug efflux MFS transporter n=1 Tax=Pontibacterium granulatum TaxID=2036029 RepID=UPI00249B6B8E|nr:Bcr/CflA family multidrug efflux MFS transporter [Pontibacterium granulatum]MDI3324104.1 Bcr/CflA family multidrug efflux MFS transporter [Pontibacterium granulatum]